MNRETATLSGAMSAGKTIRLLLMVSVIIAAPLLTAPAQAQITDASIAALVEALRLSAPNTGIPNDGLYSDWKIKWENILRWSKRCAGSEMDPAEFEADTQKARAILSCVMGKILREQYELVKDESLAVRRAASWWMTGDPEQYDGSQARPYTLRVLDAYRRVLR